MDTISIGLAEPPGALRDSLDAALRPLIARGARVELRESRRGTLHFLGCTCDAEAARPDGARTVVSEFRRVIASAVAAWILDRPDQPLLRRLIRTRYAYLGPDDRESILALAGREEDPDAPAAEEVRALVRQRLTEYLERQATLVVDGFVTFRLKDYVERLVGAVDRAVDAFLLEREHREFVDLLRHMVESRPDRPTAVDCLFDGGGRFALRDAAGRDVARAFLEDARPEAAASDIGADDLLVSALITVAPRRVRLHLPDGTAALSPDVLNTLEAVFPGAVRVCRGCGSCRRAAGGAPDGLGTVQGKGQGRPDGRP